MRINREHRAEAQSQDASSAVDVLVDGSVLGEEGIAPLRGQHAPDQREVDRRIARAAVPPVDDARKRFALDEDVAEMEIPVYEDSFAGC